MRRLLLALLCLAVALPAAGQTLLVSGTITPLSLLKWTAPPTATTAEQAQALQMRARVDQPITGPFLPVPQQECTPIATAPGTFACQSRLGDQLAALLNVRGMHTLTLTTFDGASESPSSLPATLELPPGCPVISATAPFTTTGALSPVGTPLGERSQWNTANFGARVAILRANGWRVDLQRVQFAIDPTPGSGYWYLIGVCAGGPQ
jgi:hypothetical protein